MQDESPTIKIILLGNPGVGKTCIISRYIDDNNGSSIGANYFEKTIIKNGKEYQLNIWDTAGQEKFHSLGKYFYKDSHVICLVYDIFDQDSLDALKSIWYPNFQKYGEKYAVLAVVGNGDILDEREDLADEEQAKAFAKEINATFMLTCPKSRDGIEKLFDVLIDKLLSNPKIEDILKGKEENIVLDNKNVNKRKRKKKCS